MTRVRVLTPPGRGAIAVVEIAGTDAARIVDAWFQPANRRALHGEPIGAIRFGRWRTADASGEPSNRRSGEELIAVRTAADRVEVHCHGGAAASAAVLRAVTASGATTVEDPPIGSISEDAWWLLSDAPTERVAGLLLDQANGALATKLDAALAAIAAGEAGLAVRIVDGLLAHERLATHGLVEPWRVVLAGPPNVGKSSLKNALVGYDRAIVYDQPGTTRDVVATATAFGGWPVWLSDTAGVHEASDPLEAAGVRLAERALATADVVVLVCEAREVGSDEARAFRDHVAAKASPETALINVASKADLGLPGDHDSSAAVLTSAKTGEGVDALVGAIGEAICPAPPRAGDGVPFRREHIRPLHAARDALASGDDASTALQAMLAPCRTE